MSQYGKTVKNQVFIIKTSEPFNMKNYGKLPKTKSANFGETSRHRKIEKHLKTYLKSSTLHGLAYVGDDKISYGERFFWLLTFVTAVCCAVYFIYSIYIKYSGNTIAVTMNPKPVSLEEVPFPAITICNMNMAIKNEANTILLNGSVTEKDVLDNICEFEEMIAPESALENDTESWNNFFKFMFKVSQPCEKMLKACRWRLQKVDCARIFNPIVTDEGLCCTFNMLPLDFIFRNVEYPVELNSTLNNYDNYQVYDWNPETGYPNPTSHDVYPFPSPGPGAHLGLSIILDVDVDNYYCSSSSSVGTKMLLHHPAEIPKMADFGFMLSPGFEIRIVYKANINDASEQLRAIEPQIRQCYFNNEKHLKFFRTYTRINCKTECLANITLRHCGCVPFYLPHGPETRLCETTQEACSDNVKEMVDLKEIPSAEEKRCDCLSSCHQLDFEKSMSYGKITNTFKLKEDIGENADKNYFRKNTIIAQIYFVNTQFTKYTKTQLYGISEFLSSVGGILGLFLGFSILSAVEMLYHLSLKLICNSIRTNRNYKY